jgi:hypothetical protein
MTEALTEYGKRVVMIGLWFDKQSTHHPNVTAHCLKVVRLLHRECPPQGVPSKQIRPPRLDAQDVAHVLGESFNQIRQFEQLLCHKRRKDRAPYCMH